MLIGLRTFRKNMGFGASGAMTPKILCVGQIRMKWTARRTSRGGGQLAAGHGTPNWLTYKESIASRQQGQTENGLGVSGV